MSESGRFSRLLAAFARDRRPSQAPASAGLRGGATTDTLTGLSLRDHFVAQLDLRLADPFAGGRALLLLRVPKPEALNLRLGRDATEHLLGAVGQLLLIYLDRVPGSIAGRLNGSDFALYLPASGVARETALSLQAALVALTALRSAAISAWVGGVDGLPCLPSGNALAEADAALARAEAGEGDGVVVDAHIDLRAAARGSAAWRWQVAGALDAGRVRLQSTRVLDREGRTVHLRCEPQLQLSEETSYQSARLGLALARRSGLLPRLDGVAVRLALLAIAGDGQARCLRVSAPSLQTPGFVDGLAAALGEMPAQAPGLSLLMSVPEWPQALPELLSAATAWSKTGAHVGMDSTGLSPAVLLELAGAGVSFVTLPAQQLQGLLADESSSAAANHLLAALRGPAPGLSLTVLADEVMSEEDLALAWDLGLDGATARV
jgi:predicted signal transduction protein with EAL and GGDEF domain